ncbi:BC_2427 family protein [Metabacillus halosaccharovorans]|uniref:DUF7852 domain-containing protein n=1 Tax=Metabacillus halosaccharovorans TaxID=930124 RepID=A0ABT3DIP5_9BACI|nr:hypothetical protein [Metabacillus halosaccharovorans]MCV9886527.1 hypothetical protein [Metabacillus halosaccharovorans]
MLQFTNNKTNPFPLKNQAKVEMNKSTNKLGGSTNYINGKSNSPKIKMTTIPFSSYIHIDSFLHNPIYGNKIKQNIQLFEEKKDDQHVDQQQFTTTTYYQDQPFCKLVSSDIRLMTDLNKKGVKQNQVIETLPNNFTPIHTGQSTSTETVIDFELEDTQVYPKTLLPIVLGEYQTEIVIHTTIPFKKGITNIVDVTKEVVLTNCKFLPTDYSLDSNKMKRHVSKGTLFIEGFIDESIEFIPALNSDQKPPREWIKKICYQIDQVLIIELQLLLLQQQVINSSSSSS